MSAKQVEDRWETRKIAEIVEKSGHRITKILLADAKWGEGWGKEKCAFFTFLIDANPRLTDSELQEMEYAMSVALGHKDEPDMWVEIEHISDAPEYTKKLETMDVLYVA